MTKIYDSELTKIIIENFNSFSDTDSLESARNKTKDYIGTVIEQVYKSLIKERTNKAREKEEQKQAGRIIIPEKPNIRINRYGEIINVLKKEKIHMDSDIGRWYLQSLTERIITPAWPSIEAYDQDVLTPQAEEIKREARRKQRNKRS